MADHAYIALLDLSDRPLFGPSPHGAAFGDQSSILRSTLARMKAGGLVPALVAARALPESGQLLEILGDLDVPSIVGEPGESSTNAALRWLATQHIEAATLIDAAAAFVSPTVVKSQVARLEAGDVALVLSPRAALGLAAVCGTTRGLSALARAELDERTRDPLVRLEEVARRTAAWVDTAYVDCDARFECYGVDLLPATRRGVDALACYEMPASSEDYRPVFQSLGGAAWAKPLRASSDRTRRPASRPRALLVNYLPFPYGAGRWNASLLRAWRTERLDVEVATSARNELSEAFAEVATTHVVPIRYPTSQVSRRPGDTWIDDVESAAELLRKVVPDIVINSGPSPAFAVAARARGVPVISVAHATFRGSSPAHVESAFRGSRFELSDTVLALMPWIKDDLEATLCAPPGRVRLIPTGTDTTFFNPAQHDRNACRRALGLAADDRCVLFSGALLPWKRPELAVAAFVELTRRNPRSVFVLAGGDPSGAGMISKLEAEARRAGVGDRVRLLGFVASHHTMAEHYRAADVLLHTALIDTAPLSILEAQSMALPVVCFDSQGPGAIVLHGETGYKVGTDASAAELAECIAELFASDQRRDEMGAAARRHCLENYSIAGCANAVQAIALELIERAGGST